MSTAPPIFVDRQTLAERCQISVDTLDAWVRDGFLPPPTIARGQIRRWHWPTIEERLLQLTKTPPSDPFLQGLENADEKAHQRRAP